MSLHASRMDFSAPTHYSEQYFEVLAYVTAYSGQPGVSWTIRSVSAGSLATPGSVTLKSNLPDASSVGEQQFSREIEIAIYLKHCRCALGGPHMMKRCQQGTCHEQFKLQYSSVQYIL